MGSVGTRAPPTNEASRLADRCAVVTDGPEDPLNSWTRAGFEVGRHAGGGVGMNTRMRRILEDTSSTREFGEIASHVLLSTNLARATLGSYTELRLHLLRIHEYPQYFHRTPFPRGGWVVDWLVGWPFYWSG